MKIKVKNFRHAWLILYFAVYIAWFYLDEKLITGSYTAIHIWLDNYIPFCEYFVLPYVLWYPFFTAVGLHLLFRDEYDFCRYVWAMIIGLSVCLTVYLIFPNGQDLRPEVFPRDNMFTRLIGRLYSADSNTNVFPSMHVYGTIAPTVAVFKSRELGRHFWVKAAAAVVCVLICLSTVFIKQHSALDIIGGAALYPPIYWLIYRKDGRGRLWIWPAKPLQREKSRLGGKGSKRA